MALESLASGAEQQVHVADRLDAIILEGIEQQEGCCDRDLGLSLSDAKSRAERTDSPSLARPLPPAGSADSLCQPTNGVRIDVEEHTAISAWPSQHVACSCRVLCQQLVRRLFVELLGALLILANHIAIIAVFAPPLVDPTLAVHDHANGTEVLKYGFADDMKELRETMEIDVLRDVCLLMIRPFYALAIARLISLLLGCGVRCGQRLLPGIALLVLKSLFAYGCALPAMLFPAVCGVFLTLPVDKHAWRALFSIHLFLPMAMWLMSAGLSLVLLDAAVQLWQDHLTVHHYEQRTQSAYEHQRALRKIAAAIRSAERKQLLPRADTTADAPGRGGSGHFGSAMAAALQARLEFLTGPLDFGSDIAEAATIGQARKRAARLFRSLLRQHHLRAPLSEDGGSGELPLAVDRDALLAWAYRHDENMPPRLAAELFPYGRAVDAEHFIKVVERSYKEQRLITASVASFDRLHAFLLHGLQGIWAVVLLTVLLMLWGIDLLAWLLPIGSTLLVVCTLAGGLTTDVMSSFFFAYVTRPYDIGDRVCIASPGHESALKSLIVKDVFLLRTHFITANGESMMINNSAVKGMALTNYSRSGKLTLLVTLMVPAATPSAKIGELTDAITEYIKDKSNEWSDVMLMFGDAMLDKGHLMLNIWPTSVFEAHEVVSIYSAKSRLLRFCHAYMQLANIEYIAPVQPFRESPAPGVEPREGGRKDSMWSPPFERSP